MEHQETSSPKAKITMIEITIIGKKLEKDGYKAVGNIKDTTLKYCQFVLFYKVKPTLQTQSQTFVPTQEEKLLHNSNSKHLRVMLVPQGFMTFFFKKIFILHTSHYFPSHPFSHSPIPCPPRLPAQPPVSPSKG